VKIAGRYSFNGGLDLLNERYPSLLAEVESAIAQVDASKHKRKRSKEKTMRGQLLYSPVSINSAFKKCFAKFGWKSIRVPCEYSTSYYTPGYDPKRLRSGAFREMDFVKESLGVEVQFGKYAFMVYNVCAKMTIFRNLKHIDAGIEIVPVKAFADEMSSGVSYFEQFLWDLETRGVANIDVPVLILGIDA
jgi:Restriction endonuclease BglII